MLKNITNKFIKHSKKTFNNFVMTKSFPVYALLSFGLLFFLCPGASIGTLLFSTLMGLITCFGINFILTAMFSGKEDTSDTKDDSNSYSASKKIYFQFNKEKIKQYKNSKEKEIFNNLK